MKMIKNFNQRVATIVLFGLVIFLFMIWKWQPYYDSLSQNKIKPLVALKVVSGPISFFDEAMIDESNGFEVEDGLFSFRYSNHLTVKKYRGIYYVRDLKNGRVVFQIFQNHSSISFNQDDFNCVRYSGLLESFKDKQACFTKNPPKNFVGQLTLFGVPHRFLSRSIYFFENKNLLISGDFHYYDFFSRAEALSFILRWRYPEKDFSEEVDDCFADISADHPFSGPVCFAKKEGIVVGISNSFYPEQSVNLHGILKMLFLVFDVEDYEFNEKYLDESLFAQMQKIHIAYPLIAKAYFEGLFTNVNDQIHWANRHIFKGEALLIMHRFFEWKSGRQFKKYQSRAAVASETRVYLKNGDFDAVFEEKSKESFDEDDMIVTTKLVPVAEDVEVYFLDEGGVYRYLITIQSTRVDEISSLFASFDNQRLKGKLAIFLKNGESFAYKLKRKNIDFTYLKDRFQFTGYPDTLNRLETAKLLPNLANYPKNKVHPEIKIYMDEYDFESIFMNRTGNDRYPAYLEMVYPDGSQFGRSILIKTRGNASRGYIKSSFTIETFRDFIEDLDYKGDEFLVDADEFKLRSFINEETMIHEKLFYYAFKSLGYEAPDYFDATIEVNGVKLGFYQVTEAIKKPFFKGRNLKVNDYYYARNLGSTYDTNLGYYETDELTLSQYKMNGNPHRLLGLINRIKTKDPSLMNQLDVKNIVDYAITVYLLGAYDSITHNYYIYFDQSEAKWNIFPWDADDALYSVRRHNIWEFLKFARNKQGSYNELFYYVFKELSFDEIKDYFNDYKKRWIESVDLVGYIDELKLKNEDYYRYDNQLWNGRFLERKKYVYDTIQAIDDLKALIKESLNVK